MILRKLKTDAESFLGGDGFQGGNYRTGLF